MWDLKLYSIPRPGETWEAHKWSRPVLQLSPQLINKQFPVKRFVLPFMPVYILTDLEGHKTEWPVDYNSELPCEIQVIQFN